MVPATTVLIRVAPAILSAIAFTNRLAQYFALSTFLSSYIPAHKRPDVALVFQAWVKIVVGRIWPGVILLVLILRISIVTNLLYKRDELLDGSSWIWYTVALVMSFAHLAVAKPMLSYENEMKDQNTRPLKSLECLKKWLKVNNVRLFVIDLPMVVVTLLAAVAAVGSLASEEFDTVW